MDRHRKSFLVIPVLTGVVAITGIFSMVDRMYHPRVKSRRSGAATLYSSLVPHTTAFHLAIAACAVVSSANVLMGV